MKLRSPAARPGIVSGREHDIAAHEVSVLNCGGQHANRITLA
jgi:hypothetical protein